MNGRLTQAPRVEDLQPLLPPRSNNWLSTRQAEALAQFRGLPTKRVEDWKYTDINPVANALPQWLATQPDEGAEPAASLDIKNALRIRVVDGRIDAGNSSELPDGMVAGPLDAIAETFGKDFQSRFGGLATDTDSGFIALNTAFATDSVMISVPADTQVEQPVYIEVVSTTVQIAVQPRILIDLGPGSKATVIEHYAGPVHALVNAVTEIRCADNAELHFYKLQDEHTESWHTAVQYAEVGRGAALRTTQLDIGGGLARNELHIRLTGEGAHADATGLFMADGKRHVESRITVNHLAPHTTSEEQFRGILGDAARGVFNGRIYVADNAQKTSAELSNRNLLLSKGAEINTKPELEIYADDVKCAHGATTGQLDSNALFYLLSRGVDPNEARNMLITAFAGELLTGIEVPALAERVQNALAKLGGLNDFGAAE